MILTEKSICSGFQAVLFFLIAIEPFAFTYFRVTDIVYEILTFFMLAIVLVLHSDARRKNRNGISDSHGSKIPYLVILYNGYLLVVTLWNGGPAKSVLMRGVQFANLALYVDMVLKNNPKALFETGLNILTFYIILNCICYFVFPGGLYADAYFETNYLLGYDNQNINFILPALIFVLIKHQYYKKCRLQILFIYAISLITVIRAWSGMSMVVIISTSAFAFFFFKRGKGFVASKILNGRIFNLFNLFIINVVSFVGLVFLHLENYFEFFIEGVLQKSMTLSGRTVIWERTLEFIKERPIFGYGREITSERSMKFGFGRLSPRGLHAHNRFLETMYEGGIILMGIYLYMLFYTIHCLKAVRDTFYGKILAFGIFIYLMGMLTEQYPYCPFFWVFMVMAENAVSCIKKSPVGMDA